MMSDAYCDGGCAVGPVNFRTRVYGAFQVIRHKVHKSGNTSTVRLAAFARYGHAKKETAVNKNNIKQQKVSASAKSRRILSDR